ncbi:BQ5605_C006g03996 [Microbotryum silenes-dioicae]|uniref:BQ5605_C006g03996 protein n=1 Tax=Microbotryum silenes-dioicae TaxID=796604 RepID=A0A2X0M5N0_9BASI|nr:BQ5605_C006g03996 [Microbotryum silenes-dioicae]
MRTRIASSVRRDEGGAPPMFSASRTPRTAIALSDITNNLVDTKPDLSAGKKKVPAGAHQRAPLNKAKPSKAAAATASDAKPVKPVKPVKLLKLEKPEKSSRVDAVAEDDNSLHASTHSSDGDLMPSPPATMKAKRTNLPDQLQQPLKKASSKRQRNDTPDDLSDCSEDNLPLTEALSIFSTALATARSDLHKLIGRVQRKEVDMLRAMQSWYKDNPTTYTDEHLAWWSVLRLVEQTDVERGFADNKREFWLHLSGFATTLAKKAAQRFYHARYCPNGAFDYSIFLYRTVVSQFYDADTSPMTTRPKVSTMDSTFQAQCTTVITTCQPVADFQRLVLDLHGVVAGAMADPYSIHIAFAWCRPFDRRGTRPASSKLARLRSTTLLHEFARGLRARKPTWAPGGHPMGAMNFTQRCVAIERASRREATNVA